MEIYKGTKFETIFLKQKPNFSNFKVKKLIYWGKLFQKNNLAPSYGKGSSGNLSFRTKNGFIITPTASFFSKLKEKDLIEVLNFDLNKKIAFVNGTKIPSSETPLHFLIYKKRKDVNVVFHFHDDKLLERVNELNIPLTSKAFDYGTIDTAETVSKLLEKNDFCCIKEHGFVIVGKSIDEVGCFCLKLHDLIS